MNCRVCGATIEGENFDQCWNCLTPLNVDAEQAEQLRNKNLSSSMTCMRCKGDMRYAGLKKFHEGSRGWGFWLGDLGELFVNRESFDVYVCPSCGKIELFVDGIGDEHRPDRRKGV